MSITHRLKVMSATHMQCSCGFIAFVQKIRRDTGAVRNGPTHEAWEGMAEHFQRMAALEVVREGDEVVVVNESHELYNSIGIAKLVGMQTVFVRFTHLPENVMLKLEDVRSWAAREAATDALAAQGR